MRKLSTLISIFAASRAGSEWWKTAITEHILKNNLTGIWIDNNEMAGMIDDEGVFAGEVPMFDASTGSAPSNVESRMGWGGEATRIGSVGKAVQTAGMARASRFLGCCDVLQLTLNLGAGDLRSCPLGSSE